MPRSQRIFGLNIRPRLEVILRWIVGEDGLHRRSPQVELIHWRDAENLLDRTRHVDLRVEGVSAGPFCMV
jgi:hypothetical protein